MTQNLFYYIIYIYIKLVSSEEFIYSYNHFFEEQKKYPHIRNTSFDNQQLSSVKFSWNTFIVITRAPSVTLLGLLLSRLHVYILQGVYICHNHSHEMHIVVPCNASDVSNTFFDNLIFF